MFYPFILPLKITCFVVFAGMVATVIAVTRRGGSRRKSLDTAALAGAILFVPLCIAIGLIVNAVRYGEFGYATAEGTHDPHIELPEEATGITLHKYGSGHALRFHVEQGALERWMDTVYEERRSHGAGVWLQPFTREETPSDPEFVPVRVDPDFERYGWRVPEDTILYKGSRAGNGAGYDVWYSPGTGTAFVSAAYW